MTELAPKKLRLEPNAAKDKGAIEVTVYPESTSVPTSRSPYRVPFFIPRGEAYYWTREWQHDESEALKELERGEGRVFHDPKEAARWLRSSED